MYWAGNEFFAAAVGLSNEITSRAKSYYYFLAALPSLLIQYGNVR